MPRVSVLVAAFDAATTIRTALESVAGQGFRDWECVVVDDGSTDATAASVQGFVSHDPRFRLLRRPHQGVVAARNLGLAACGGDFIAIFDADDHMAPDRLGAQLEAFAADPGLAAVGCHVRYLPRSACSDGRLAYEQWLNAQRTPADVRRDRYIEMPVGHPTLMVRAPLLRSLGYRDMGWPEDWDMLQRLLDSGGEVGVVPRPLHEWTLSESSLSRRDPAYADSHFTRCRAAFLASGFLHEHECYGLIGYGDTGKQLRKALTAQGRSCHAIYELHPGRIGQVIDGAEIWHHDRLPEHRQTKLLVSVAGAAARTFLRSRLAAWGFRDGIDFVCTA